MLIYPELKKLLIKCVEKHGNNSHIADKSFELVNLIAELYHTHSNVEAICWRQANNQRLIYGNSRPHETAMAWNLALS